MVLYYKDKHKTDCYMYALKQSNNDSYLISYIILVDVGSSGTSSLKK